MNFLTLPLADLLLQLTRKEEARKAIVYFFMASILLAFIINIRNIRNPVVIYEFIVLLYFSRSKVKEQFK